jgi:F-type H+-transporting ATPase subunit delta
MRNLAGNRALASRYARALFETAVSEADPRAVDRELAEFVALFEQSAPLRRVLWNPAVPVARKRAVVSEITRRAHYAAPLEKLLKLMAQRDHLALLQPLLDAYRRRLMDHLGIVQAEVTTAAPLSPDRLGAVEQALAAATGKRVTISPRVDPAIIGGVVTKVDSTVYDGSVVRHLERIKEKMIASVDRPVST